MNKVRPLPSGQSVYKPFHSTETALLKVQSDILLNMDDQKVTLLVMLDISATFDTNWPQYLIRNLRFRFWCGGTALKWFTSYLSQRTQQVQIKGTLSEKKQLTNGVPQGSCLGPVLFTIYVADLFQIIEKAPPRSRGLCRWPSSLPIIQTHSFHESNNLSHCHWKLCDRTEELDDFQHVNGEWQQDRIIDCRKQTTARTRKHTIHSCGWGSDHTCDVSAKPGCDFWLQLENGYASHKSLPKRLLSSPQHQENPKIPEPGSHVHDYTCIYHKLNLLLQQFDEWTTREYHQETPSCANHSCQTNFQSEQIWLHNSRIRYASLPSSQIPDWIQNTVGRLQRTSWRGTYLHPINDHPIKKQKIFHKTQWRTCPEGSKIQSWYFWQACILSVWASGMELLAKGN